MIIQMMIRRSGLVGARGAETHKQLEHTSQVAYQPNHDDVSTFSIIMIIIIIILIRAVDVSVDPAHSAILFRDARGVSHFNDKCVLVLFSKKSQMEN